MKLDSPASDITFAKIVSVPKSGEAWSQAYNAGKLFAVLSLSKIAIDRENPDSISVLGKDLIGKLEEEFFTLDLKDLKSIKQAILNTLNGVQEGIECSFAASFLSNKNLYIFTAGLGSVFIIRNYKIAKFSAREEKDPKSITAFLGSLKNNDVMILATNDLSGIINQENFLNLGTTNPIETAEYLSPKVLEKEDGKTSLIIVKYEQSLSPKQEVPIQKEKQEEPKETKNYFAFIQRFKNIMPIKNIKLNHSKKVILTLSVIVLAIFISSVYFGIKKQQSAKIQSVFEKAYPNAERKYTEGNSLIDLNKNKARENFIDAKTLLEQARSQLPKDSKEEKKIIELLKKVNQAIVSSSGINLVSAKEVDPKESIFLFSQIKKQDGQFAYDKNNIYFANTSSIYIIEKTGSNKESEIIKNNDFWEKPIALGVYLNNIYILDKVSRQILKFVPIETGYGQNNYLANNVTPDFSNIISMAIDGSIYLLSKDGIIQKFTRGKPETFTVSGLDNPFSSPLKVFTDKNTTNIYVLDNGNSRIVLLNKEGVYQNQYQADILKTTRDFEVLESSKKIFVLSQNKIYEIDLK